MNTNPNALAVANEKIRPLCRKLVAAKYLLAQVKEEFNAVGGLSLFPNDAEVLADGAPDDGRSTLTNAEVRDIAGAINDILAAIDGHAALDLLVKAQAIGE